MEDVRLSSGASFSTSEGEWNESDFEVPLQAQEYLRGILVDFNYPALILGLNPDEMQRFVHAANNTVQLPPPPRWLNLQGKLSANYLMDCIIAHLASLSGGSCGCVVAPCTLQQYTAVVKELLSTTMQGHRWMQAVGCAALGIAPGHAAGQKLVLARLSIVADRKVLTHAQYLNLGVDEERLTLFE